MNLQTDPKSQIDLKNLPKHIAIIMDGNGRWAKKQGALRIFGHKSAVKSVRQTTEAAAEIGIQFLTLYAFSTENWNRPQLEVKALMTLLVNSLNKELPTLQKNNIKLNTIGNIQNLPENAQKNLQKVIIETQYNNRMTLTLALSYGSRNDLTQAIQQITKKIVNKELEINEITPELISQHLSTNNIPDPELLIRTSGEYRISNFLLWEIAYSELYFTPILWPDFTKNDLYEAILNYQQRERRFGFTSEQIKGKI